MRADQRQRDGFSSALLRQRTDVADDLADLVDLASIHQDVRQQIARVLGGLEAEG
jgi:hypothetical protein